MTRSSSIRIFTLPILTDNYSYIIQHVKSNICAVVDCSEPEKVANAVKELGLELGHALTTHKHWDHAGGNKMMKKLFPKAEIVGSSSEPVEAVTKLVSNGDKFYICNGQIEVEVFESPCHTKGHILYYIQNEAIFVGDTFFVAGCGRFFEGGAQQMWNNVQLVRKLPSSVKMYCGHEYTINNIKFALTIDPENDALIQKKKWAEEQRKSHRPTVPSTLEEEFMYNPFFRCDQPEIMKKVGKDDPVSVMKEIRERKDRF